MEDNYKSHKFLEEVISSKMSALALAFYKYHKIPLTKAYSILHLSEEYGEMEFLYNDVWYETLPFFYGNVCKENNITPIKGVFESVYCDKVEEAEILSDVFEGVRVRLGMYGATLERVFAEYKFYDYILEHRNTSRETLITQISQSIKRDVLAHREMTLKPWARKDK